MCEREGEKIEGRGKREREKVRDGEKESVGEERVGKEREESGENERKSVLFRSR